MNKETRLARAERYIEKAEENRTSPTDIADRYVELAKVHIMLANATESMNVLTDKELAQAKKNLEILEKCGRLASEMIALGGETGTAGRLLYDKLYYS